MSLETKVRFAGVLAELTEIGREAGIPTKRTEALRAAVESLPLLVPVVGEFSAGKSSLLNLITGAGVLAKNILHGGTDAVLLKDFRLVAVFILIPDSWAVKLYKVSLFTHSAYIHITDKAQAVAYVIHYHIFICQSVR